MTQSGHQKSDKRIGILMPRCRLTDVGQFDILSYGSIFEARMQPKLTRREFVAAGSVLFAFSFQAHAQDHNRPRRIAMMIAPAEDDPEGQARVAAFRNALQALGWIEGQNLQIDYRWEAGPARSTTYAAELVKLAPEVIVANGSPAVSALHQATRSIPIVFVVVVDPVGAGYVQNLARPGGNITGFSTFEPDIGTKWLELLKEASPNLRRAAVIWDPGFKGFLALWRAIEGAARGFGVEAAGVPFHDDGDDIESGIAKLAREPGGGLIVLPTTLNHTNRERIFSIALRHRLPAIYPFQHYAADGGLMAYGFDNSDLFKRGALYVDRILRGESPGNLPVQAPTKFELIVNLRTARAMELTIPESFLLRADALID
jgi:putative ABC transport system substrate-binding protein